MRCCVPLCDISSETLVSKSRSAFIPKAVTFHGFPTVSRLRNLWLDNLRLDQDKLPERAVVCSQHFNKDDFYFTRSNLRKLRYDAIPLEVIPPEAKFCVICLDTGCTLYPLSNQNLHEAYSILTGISTAHKLNEALKLCMECAQRLLNYRKLRDKSLRAHNLMLQLVTKHGQLTTHNVRAVNRIENKLASDLVQDISEPDYFGPYIADNLDESDVMGKEIKPFEGEYLSMKSDISDHNYSKLDGEIDSDVDYEIERPSEFEETCGDDIKTNSNILDVDEVIKPRKGIKSTSRYSTINDETVYSDTFENMYDDDIKTNVKILNDDDDEFKSYKVKKATPNYDITNDVESDNDKLYGDSDEFEDMYDVDDIETNSKTLDDDEFDSSKVKKSTSSNGISNSVETDDKFEVEYLNNYFGENIEYLQEDVEQVALALGAKTINGKKTSGNEKQVTNVKHSNLKQEKPDLSMFKITELSHEDAVAEIMKRKYEDSYIKLPFKCKECFKSYTNKEAFDAHMERHTEKFGPLVCEVCKTHKWNITQLKNHQRNFHTLKYSCTLCPVVKTNKCQAVMHERWHKGLKYKCQHCSAEYSKHSTYMQHLRSKHPSDVTCPHCGFSFVGQQGLESHMLDMHPFIDPAQNLDGPPCEQCEIVFASVKAYRQHLEVSSKHAGDRSNDRDDASRTGRKSGKQSRKKQQKRNKPIICEECGAEVIGLRRYYRHLAEHGKFSTKYSGEPAMCEQCGKIFKSHTLLRYHMPLHSGRRQFACEVCDKRFMLKANMYLHMRVHRQNRPRYECELCGKHFANSMGRVRHIRIIHNSVKYKCDRCDKTFTTVFGRKVHVKHVHDKVPYPKRAHRKRSAARAEPQARRPGAVYYTSDSDTQ